MEKERASLVTLDWQLLSQCAWWENGHQRCFILTQFVGLQPQVFRFHLVVWRVISSDPELPLDKTTIGLQRHWSLVSVCLSGVLILVALVDKSGMSTTTSRDDGETKYVFVTVHYV